ncbi:ribosomal protein S18-alanine N-acetyltransferase [Paucibacter sp. R3-3]|uniref:[Ribosomal protein bS18]-alanine N-acetyltransferase n=1 Tax=Roseateles agri TaxID=3098619 RepID=A0ABU5DEJ5_9BURK|nr:ribosomal protein S18-alanine N-acetyltransferase [Paucibacter sp. R3-3]MDY0743577.1 ribosomal protein S18-alanine N-acetyltransferase [Paucibacter sp. R3-3]
MSALAPPRPSLGPGVKLSRLQAVDVPEVMAIETRAYLVPWSAGNFIDSLAAGYLAYALRDENTGELVGYFLAMKGVEEMHLLNITVEPERQGQGLARLMLDKLCEVCRRESCPQLWLEVRVSNERARAVYARYGFTEVGVRKRYYPMPGGAREDAVLMSLGVAA